MKYDIYLDRIAQESIEARCNTETIIRQLQDIVGKLDTLISLKQVELQYRQLPQAQQQTTQQQ